MNIRKVVTGGGQGTEADEDVVQSVDDCNEQVAALFGSKSNLVGVTLKFAEGGRKKYRIADGEDADTED